MSYVLIYFTIGFTITFLVEFTTQTKRTELESQGFDWFDRLFNITLWPITIMLFIKNLKDLF
tara:strand:+ start:866 stop:1051 length:186 start_codon:yes stop_codon:yes gene_type:complete